MIIRVPRWAIAFVALAFGLYHPILGLLSLHYYTDVQAPLLAMVLYLVALVSSIVLWKDIKLPLFHAIFVATISASLPALVNPYIVGHTYITYATWYIGGLGVLFTVLLVRRQYWVAWIGAALVFAEVVFWAKSQTVVAESGLIGGFIALMAAGQAVSIGVEVAAKRAQSLADQAAREQAEAIATTVRRTERQNRATEAMRASRPILERIVSSNGRLSAAEQAEAKLAEIELRDEIRGRSLISESTRQAARLARENGIEVIFLDEGGLDQCPEEERLRLLDDVARAIAGLQVGKVTIRAPRGERWMITVVAIRPGENAPSLWLKLGC